MQQRPPPSFPRLCSPTSQLLWPGLTPRDRASSATTHRLPDTDQRRFMVDHEASRFLV